MKTSVKIISLIFACLALAGCSSGSSTPSTVVESGGSSGNADSGGGSAGNVTGGTGADTGTSSGVSSAAIAGFWDISDEEDTFYFEIFADNTGIFWDYDGDLEGDGENCYYRAPVSFTNLGNNRYDFGIEVITMVVSGNRLVITDSEGTIAFPPLVGFSTTDLNLC